MDSSDDFQEAKKIRDRKRNVAPPVYNEARLSEKPMPVLVLLPDKSNSEANDDSDENLAVDPLGASNISNAIDNNETELWPTMTDANSSNLSVTELDSLDLIQYSPNNANNTTANDNNESHLNDSNFSADSDFEALNSLPNYVNETGNNNSKNESFNEFGESNATPNNTFYTGNGNGTSDLNNTIGTSMATVSTGNDFIASASNTGDPEALNSSATMDSINQNDSAVLSVALNSALNIQVKKEPEFFPMNDEDCNAVISIFDGSYEKVDDSDDDVLIHRNDVIPPPMKTDAVNYMVKKNDIVSGTIPYAVNVIFHSYFIILY